MVAYYAAKKEKGVEIDLKGLAQDEDFKKEAVKAVVNKVKETNACVLFPSYKPCSDKNPLGKLINELALTLQVKTLVTGDVKNLKRVQIPPREVIIIKQSFRQGTELKKQIEEVKAMGCKVTVLCLIAHSGAKMQGFAHETGVDVEALVRIDEINYM